MLIKAYLFVYKIFEKLTAFIRSVKFTMILNKLEIFNKRDPEDVIQVISTFILSEAPLYRDTIKMSRSVLSSTTLIKALADSYLIDHSETHLEQFIEVLKNEFIKRERE